MRWLPNEVFDEVFSSQSASKTYVVPYNYEVFSSQSASKTYAVPDNYPASPMRDIMQVYRDVSWIQTYCIILYSSFQVRKNIYYTIQLYGRAKRDEVFSSQSASKTYVVPYNYPASEMRDIMQVYR